jgi:hypothetical protein
VLGSSSGGQIVRVGVGVLWRGCFHVLEGVSRFPSYELMHAASSCM